MDLSRIKSKVKELQEKRNMNQFGEVKKVIQNGVPNIVRLIGEWSSVKRAWLECEDGKNRPFNITNDRGESILFEAINLVTEQDKIFDAQTGKVVKRPKYMDKLGELAYQIFPSKGSNGWSYSESFIWNCIDRMDSWCNLNKHTKLLVKTPSEIGIGSTAFTEVQTVVDNWGDPEGYDLNFTKTGEGFNTKYSVQPVNADKFQQSIQGPLSEEEQKYELYDIVSLTERSKSSYILKHLGKILQQIDSVLGTDFVVRLNQLESQPTPIPSVSVQTQPIVPNQPPATPIQVPINQPPAALEPQPQKSFSFRSAPVQEPTTPIAQTSIPPVQEPIAQTEPVPPQVSLKTSETKLCPICGKSVSIEGCPTCGIKFM